MECRFPRLDRVTSFSFLSCMARANGTCHVPFREHPDIDANTVPSLAWVECRRSGENGISRSAAMSKNVQRWCFPTCTARAVCTPGQTFIQCRDDLLKIYRCTKFGVLSSRLQTLGRSHVYEVPPPFSSTRILRRSAPVTKMARSQPRQQASHYV